VHCLELVIKYDMILGDIFPVSILRTRSACDKCLSKNPKKKPNGAHGFHFGIFCRPV
jgi:hypothetical protein